MGFCVKCRLRWGSRSWCHCTGCHRTFRSTGGFDKHRRDMVCIDPAEIGMEMDEKGCFYSPMNEETKKRLGFV